MENMAEQKKNSWGDLFRKIPPKKWIMLACLGVVFLLAATYMEKGVLVTEEEITMPQQQTGSYESRLEERLEKILSTVEGAGKVEVIITFLDSGEKIVNKDVDTSVNSVTEQDNAGGTRLSEEQSYQEDTILSGDSYGSGTPYVVQEMNPSVSGILVVSDGGDSPVVVEKITDALSALFNLSPHKIKVLKREA